MQRFFGLMPSSLVSIEKSYKDKYDLTIRIQAGEQGWTVIYADGGTNYKDVVDMPENNFNAAYKVAVDALGDLTEVQNRGRVCCCSEK